MSQAVGFSSKKKVTLKKDKERGAEKIEERKREWRRFQREKPIDTKDFV